MKIEKTLKNFREWEWSRYKKRKRKRLKTTDFTVIASNCSGTFIYYDMELPYLSPTINLSIEMNDFIKLCEKLKWYLEQEMLEVKGEKKPAGMLGDIKISFVHYNTFTEGAEKWEKRKQKINWDNLFIIGTDKDGCTYETLRRFEQLPYENKVIFTHVKYPEFPSAYYIRGFEENSELGVITLFKEQFLKRRYLDDFDYIRFLNGSGIRK